MTDRGTDGDLSQRIVAPAVGDTKAWEDLAKLEVIEETEGKNPFGKGNYLPEGLANKLEARFTTVSKRDFSILELKDFIPHGRTAELTGNKVRIPVAKENVEKLKRWWSKSGTTVEDSSESLTETQKKRLDEALLVGAPPFLAVHYAFGEVEIKFGNRYKRARHVMVVGEPGSGKTLMSNIAAMEGYGTVDRFGLETKYGATFGKQKGELMMKGVDKRVGASETLDRLLRDFAERSVGELFRVDVCEYDMPGEPYIKRPDKIIRPTDVLDMLTLSPGIEILRLTKTSSEGEPGLAVDGFVKKVNYPRVWQN